MMGWARRFLAGVLTFAMAQFGALAAAPAHAHDASAPHAIRAETILEHAHLGADRDHTPVASSQAEWQNNPDGGAPQQDAPTDSMTHVHNCPQFTATDGAAGIAPPLRAYAFAWPIVDASAIQTSSAPPRRPPRAIL
jgi:hypothetical protein